MCTLPFVQIPVDSLVRMIGIMDKHVLDSAELYMNIAPVAVSVWHC